MAITFYRLWDLLNRKQMKKQDLRILLNPKTVAKLSKNEVVTTATLDKICQFLDCKIEDICEFERNEERG